MALNASITANYPGLEMQCSASCFDIVVGMRGKARIRYATAAHPPLLVFRNGTATSAGPFLGVVPNIELEPIDLEIDAGQRGLEEQWNPANQEFGMARVEAALGDRGRDLPAAVQRLVDEWTAFLGGSRPDDDATLIAAECLE